MIARSHKTIQGTRIEVIKLPAKDDKNSDDKNYDIEDPDKEIDSEKWK